MEGNIAARACRSKSRKYVEFCRLAAKSEYIWIHIGSNIFLDQRPMWQPQCARWIKQSKNPEWMKKPNEDIKNYMLMPICWPGAIVAAPPFVQVLIQSRFLHSFQLSLSHSLVAHFHFFIFYLPKKNKVTTRWEGPQSLSYHKQSLSKDSSIHSYHHDSKIAQHTHMTLFDSYCHDGMIIPSWQ